MSPSQQQKAAARAKALESLHNLAQRMRHVTAAALDDIARGNIPADANVWAMAGELLDSLDQDIMVAQQRVQRADSLGA